MDYQLSPYELINRLRSLLSEFCIANNVILRQNSHEDSIADELKSYLGKYFSDFPYDINHNYDLMHSGDELVKKTVEFLYNELPLTRNPKRNNSNDKTVMKAILPDFIFHDLKSGSHNFLIIEIKKSTNKRTDHRKMDLLKLKRATSGNLNYTYGCFIDITTGEEYNEQHPFSFLVIIKGEVVHHEANH